MEALGRSDELLQRSRDLVAQSVRMRAAADWKMAKSRRLIVAAAQAREAMKLAHGWGPGGS